MGCQGPMAYFVDNIPFTKPFVLALPTVAARKQKPSISSLIWSHEKQAEVSRDF